MPDRKSDRSAPSSEGAAEDDLDLWRQAMRDTRPLQGRRKASAGAPKPVESAPPKIAPKPVPRPRDDSPRKPPSPPKPPLAAGSAVGVDKRSVDRLRRGQLPPEATLDLHGMTREAARGALQGFIARAQAAGKRCVLVITGKGMPRSFVEGEAWGSERGVIRRELPMWLNQAPLRESVLAFVQAQPKHGGAGAHYLLLKKRRAERPGGNGAR